MRLYKVTKFSCKITKPCKGFRLSCKLTESYNTINNKDPSAKL